jgi:hypothetical protein
VAPKRASSGRFSDEHGPSVLLRIAEVADRIMQGSAGRGVAHATAGHLMQQNLVAVLEGDS